MINNFQIIMNFIASPPKSQEVMCLEVNIFRNDSYSRFHKPIFLRPNKRLGLTNKIVLAIVQKKLVIYVKSKMYHYFTCEFTTAINPIGNRLPVNISHQDHDLISTYSTGPFSYRHINHEIRYEFILTKQIRRNQSWKIDFLAILNNITSCPSN